jgi:antirestriction protein ArdC
MTNSTTRRRSSSRSSAAPKADVYQEITDQVIALLEQGVAPWRKPWNAELGIPRSMSTGKPYRGINPFLLALTAHTKGYSSPWWGTYKQIAARGGQVRKGEKGTRVMFWKRVVKTDEETGEKRAFFFARSFTVFNADQADGDLGLPTIEDTRKDHDPIRECDLALATYLTSGPRLTIGGNAAYYSPGQDLVNVPEIAYFDSPEEYHGALFHECVHSTGHASRLNREGIVEGHRFGDELYSKEELIAEMGAAFLAGHTGIAAATLANSASYLQSWIKVLKGEPKMLISAAAQAQKAADLILGVTHDEQDEDEAPAPAEAAPELVGAGA